MHKRHPKISSSCLTLIANQSRESYSTLWKQEVCNFNFVTFCWIHPWKFWRFLLNVCPPMKVLSFEISSQRLSTHESFEFSRQFCSQSIPPCSFLVQVVWPVWPWDGTVLLICYGQIERCTSTIWGGCPQIAAAVKLVLLTGWRVQQGWTSLSWTVICNPGNRQRCGRNEQRL